MLLTYSILPLALAVVATGERYYHHRHHGFVHRAPISNTTSLNITPLAGIESAPWPVTFPMDAMMRVNVTVGTGHMALPMLLDITQPWTWFLVPNRTASLEYSGLVSSNGTTEPQAGLFLNTTDPAVKLEPRNATFPPLNYESLALNISPRGSIINRLSLVGYDTCNQTILLASSFAAQNNFVPAGMLGVGGLCTPGDTNYEDLPAMILRNNLTSQTNDTMVITVAVSRNNTTGTDFAGQFVLGGIADLRDPRINSKSSAVALPWSEPPITCNDEAMGMMITVEDITIGATPLASMAQSQTFTLDILSDVIAMDDEVLTSAICQQFTLPCFELKDWSSITLYVDCNATFPESEPVSLSVNGTYFPINATDMVVTRTGFGGPYMNGTTLDPSVSTYCVTAFQPSISSHVLGLPFFKNVMATFRRSLTPQTVVLVSRHDYDN